MVAAAVAALVAAVGVWAVAGGSGDDGMGDAGGMVAVVRVARDVARGTPAEEALADGSLEVVEVPVADAAAGGAVVPDALAGTVAGEPVTAGGLLTAGVFTPSSGSGAVLGGRLPTPGHTALAITLDATRAVGGWVRPGDRVNLLVPGLCADEAAALATAAAAGAEVRCRRARYLYQAVDVLAVGSALGTGGDTGPGPATGALTLVLSLPPRAAQWVATWENELTLALVPPDYVPRVVEPLPTVVDRLPGEQEVTLRPDCADPGAPGPPGEVAACPEGTVP